MDEQNTPGLDAPATRTIVGLLVGIVLTAGAFLGGYLAFGGSNDAKPLVSTNQESKLSPEAAKLKVWHLDAGRIIGPVVIGLGNAPQGDRAAVCRVADKGRVDALTQIPAAPVASVENMYRQWVQDIAGIEALCSKKASVEDINKQIVVSGTSFSVFFEAIETLVPSTNTTQGGNTAVSRGVPGPNGTQTAPNSDINQNPGTINPNSGK
ncbi:MAG: hypothetical protein ACKOW9_04800 [Candidatus Paceibacterota bacterium]